MGTTTDGRSELQCVVDRHPIWDCRLLAEARAGALDRRDFQYLFGQYAAYSRNFTRYLAALMARSDDDYYRARLSQNLWEEGGGAAPETRHAALFREFLARIEVDPARVTYSSATLHFVEQYLDASAADDHVYATAFLGLGTEGVVSRIYRDLVTGMVAAGIPDEQLHFFHLHIECDDDHALTLVDMLTARANEPGWFERARRGVSDALDARLRFFDDIHAELTARRYQPLIQRLRAREPIAADAAPERFRHAAGTQATPMYANVNERLRIKFAVERLPLAGCEVLDPRMVRVPPEWRTEKHRHAHESLFYIVDGTADVLVGDNVVRATRGDVVFVPRWVFHQTLNAGSTELVVLAITDFGLASAVLGDYDRKQRLAFGGADATG
jgi:mannose-6-phosphate isomerase-like protein (cupin superfamily)/pyrroloquinoline quinone (PQQ) biosynthesis protein C